MAILLQSESSPSPASAAARYDSSLGAWVLSRYADVLAALLEPRLSGGEDDAGAHVAVRDAARRGLSPDHLAEWRAMSEASARALVATLPAGEPIDLSREFAKPWALSLAVTAVGAAADDASRLARLSREVFLAAAHATSTNTPAHALAASQELAQTLATTGTHTASAAVQTFTALSQTLPCAVSSAWHELLRHPDSMARLRAEFRALPRMVDELLRLAGPSRAVFRRASADVEIGDARIGAGQRVVLMLSAANRDPEKFADPDRVDLDRDTSGHVAFGRGAHSCSGAPMIRLAVSIATQTLLAATTRLEPADGVQWLDGFAIRGVVSLPIRLWRDPWP